MIESFFLLFTGLWALIPIAVILSIIYIACVEHDDYGWAIGTTIVAAFLCHKWLFSIEWSLKAIALYVLAYGVAGGVWSLFRWFKYCKKKIADNPYEKRASYECHTLPEDYYAKMLVVSNHKSRITGWIVFWPWSLLWNVTGDFFTFIYDSLVGFYTKIANYLVRAAIPKK